MATLVTVRWCTPEPSAIDERLVVGDDGRAQLQVLRPRGSGDSVGLFAGALGDAEARELAALGPDVEVDVVAPDPRVAAVSVLAERVARRLLDSPSAAAQFFARPVAAGDSGAVTLALGVLGRGLEPAEFELDAAGSQVHFTSGGSPLVVAPLPDLAAGFSTVDAEGLGGLRRRASVPPGVLGAISLDLTVPAGADEVSVQVAGTWHFADAAANAPPERFELRTEPQPV
jgi:hypothetical protein